MAESRKEFEGGSAAMVALAAELSKHAASFERIKQAGGIRAPKAIKKPTIWQRQNPGLQNRQQKMSMEDKRRERARKKTRLQSSGDRDDGDGETADAEQRRMATLERKAQIYDAVKRGEMVPERIQDELLIEVDRDEDDDDSESESDADEFRSRRRAVEREDYARRLREREERATGKLKHDPWVEYEDEFGRTRLVRQSELPPPPSPPRERLGIHNPENPFPVFQRQDMEYPSSNRASASKAVTREGGDSAAVGGHATHYDSRKERRAQGVGFYTFSKDENERLAQMEALRNIRMETEMQQKTRMSIFDKRRADIEARKLKLQAKREKSLASTLIAPTTTSSPTTA